MDEHDRIADEALQDADRVQEASEDLKRDIKDTREDWEQKTKTESVPGAIDPDEHYADEDEDEDQQPEPEYEEIKPQAADASGGGGDSGDDS